MSTSQWSSTNNLTTKSNYIPNSEEAMLSASDKAAEDYFGSTIAIDDTGTRVIVGAYGADTNSLNYAGKAYIFVRSGSSWTQEAILKANTPAITEYFGFNVAITGSGDRVAIGAYGANGSIASSGALYIFNRSGTTWTFETKIIASQGFTGIGTSVDITSDGSRIASGNYFSEVVAGMPNAGAAYIFS